MTTAGERPARGEPRTRETSAPNGTYVMRFLRTPRDRFDRDLVLGREYRLDQLTEAFEAMREFRAVTPVVRR